MVRRNTSYCARFDDDIFEVVGPQGVENLRFSVSWDPRPQRCHRYARNGSGGVYAYNPDAGHIGYFRRAIRSIMGLTTNSDVVFDGSAHLKLTVLFQIRRPSSHYRRRGNLVADAPHYPTACDIDNYVKFVMDGMQSVVYPDDRRVHFVSAAKVFATNDQVGKTYISLQRIA